MSEDRGSVGLGVAIGIGMSLAGGVVLVILGFIGVFAIGLLQALWVLPTYLYFRKDGQSETAKGILIIAGITFLLNATCWGIVLSPKL